jgi:hypothetical protein
MIAQDNAGTLDQMYSRSLYTIEDAQADGFAPTEALQFVDAQPSANPAVVAQRQAEAQAYSGQLKAQVAALYTHDTEVGTNLTNAVAGEGKIQFVDHTFKTDGGPVCDDPDYERGIERRMGGATIVGGLGGGTLSWATLGGAAAAGAGEGAAVTAETGPGILAGAAGGAFLAFLAELANEVTGDGPKCK